MINVPTSKQTRPLGVLLGGSGRACMMTIRPRVAALLRPTLRASDRSGSGIQTCAAAA